MKSAIGFAVAAAATDALGDTRLTAAAGRTAETGWLAAAGWADPPLPVVAVRTGSPRRADAAGGGDDVRAADAGWEAPPDLLPTADVAIPRWSREPGSRAGRPAASTDEEAPGEASRADGPDGPADDEPPGPEPVEPPGPFASAEAVAADAMAAPTPKATARPPTRPTQHAQLDDER